MLIFMRHKLFTLAISMLVFAFAANSQKQTTKVDKTPLTPKKLEMSSKAQWDVQFTFDAVEAASPGIETNGTYFYTTTWNAGNFHRYDMDGANAETFTITGVSAIRDLAYVESTGYFYGSDASMTIQIMDLDNEASIGTITVDGGSGVTGVRHIAYDPTLDGGAGGFWVGDWAELAAIDMAGNSLVSNSETPEITSAYGSAYDNWTDPSNPKLWLALQPATPSDAVFAEFDINTLTLTGVTHDAIADVPGADAAALSGGACTYEADGLFILAGSLQQEPNLVFGYELAVTADPTAPAGPTAFTATPDAGGALTVDLAWTNPDVDVNGDALTDLTSIDVYLNDDPTPIYTNASPTIGGDETYTATAPVGGMHTFKVVGTNGSGEGIPVTASTFVGVDVEVTSLTMPGVGAVGDVVTPIVTVKNNGVGDQTFDVTLDDGDAYSETLSVTDLASGAEDVLTFPDWTAAAAMTYTFTASASDPGSDIDMTNNTTMHDLTIFDGCEHTLVLTDSYGDGWNGATASVSVGGVVAVNSVTIETGDTESFVFLAETGDDILFEFDGGGSYPGECSWEIFDGEGTSILTGEGPDAASTNVSGNCGGPAYLVTFNVDDGANPIEGANINIASTDLTTDASGIATIELSDGEYIYTVTMTGYASVTDTINVAGEAITETVTLNPVYSVTFNVDMRDAIINAEFDPAVDTLIVAGSMNGWMEPGTDETMFMTDVDEDSIYSLEMPLVDGDHEYKYFNGAGWDGGEWEGGDNRTFTVAGEAVVLDDIWGQEVGISNTAEALDFNIYPNPTNGVLHIEVDGNSKVSIINAIGQTTNTVEINGHSTLDLTDNASGVYFIKISSENKVATKRIIVQ